MFAAIAVVIMIRISPFITLVGLVPFMVVLGVVNVAKSHCDSLVFSLSATPYYLRFRASIGSRTAKPHLEDGTTHHPLRLTISVID